MAPADSWERADGYIVQLPASPWLVEVHMPELNGSTGGRSAARQAQVQHPRGKGSSVSHGPQWGARWSSECAHSIPLFNFL